MNNHENIDDYAKWLPILGTKEIEDAHLPQPFVQRLVRIKGIYDYWLQFPTKPMSEVVDFAKQMYDIKQTQAYQDLNLVKLLLGDIESSTRSFWRWRINQMTEAAIASATRAGDYRSVASMIKNLILNNKTDKEDPIELGFENIIPHEFSMDNDISIIIPGNKKTSRETKDELIKKFSKMVGESIKYTDFTEITKKDEVKDHGGQE